MKLLGSVVQGGLLLSQQYSPVILLTTLYKVVLIFELIDKILEYDHSNELRTEQYFPVMLFITTTTSFITKLTLNLIYHINILIQKEVMFTQNNWTANRAE